MFLKYNESMNRYNSFHCGESFKINIKNEWKNVRIGLDNKGWYLIDESSNRINCKDVESAEIEYL